MNIPPPPGQSSAGFPCGSTAPAFPYEVPAPAHLSGRLDAVLPQGILEVLGCDAILCVHGIGESQDDIEPEIQQIPESEVLEGLHFSETGEVLEFITGDEIEGVLCHGLRSEKG